MINVILNVGDFTDNQLIAADYNSDGINNILDVVQLVSYILGTNFTQSVQWLEENFPSLKTQERLSKLDKSQFFAKKSCCSEKQKERSSKTRKLAAPWAETFTSRRASVISVKFEHEVAGSC